MAPRTSLKPTRSVHRIELETGSIELPEDEGAAPQARSAEPFGRDVFLLGVLVYETLESRELERLNHVSIYETTTLISIPALTLWYAQAMDLDLDPAARYHNASEAFDALNLYLAVDVGPDVCAENFDGYGTDASPMTLY